MVFGSKLTAAGIKESLASEQGFDNLPEGDVGFDEEQKVVFGCFAGMELARRRRSVEESM